METFYPINTIFYIHNNRVYAQQDLPNNIDIKNLSPIKIGDKIKLEKNCSGYDPSFENSTVEIVGFFLITSDPKCGAYPIFCGPKYPKYPKYRGWSARDNKFLAFDPSRSQCDSYFYCHVSDGTVIPVNQILNHLKSDIKESLLRVGANQATKNVKRLLLNLAKKQNLSRPATRLLIELLNSPFGEALLAFGAGHALHKTDNPKAQIFAKELRVHGLTTGGNVIVEEILEKIVPQLNTVVQSLPQIQQSSHLNELDEIEDIEENNNARILSI